MKADRLLLQEKEAFAKIQAPCPYFGTCGGCRLQDLAYADQLALKKQRLLRSLGTLDPTLTMEIVGLDDPWRYRNKAELTFSESRPPASSPQPATSSASLDTTRDASLPRAEGRARHEVSEVERAAQAGIPTSGQTGGGTPAQGAHRVTLGYHAARSFWRIVDLEDCLLLPESMSRILRDARALAQQTGQPSYNPRAHQGFFRHLLIRASHATQRLLVCLITTPGDRALIERFAEELTARHPAITSFYWGVNSKVADVAIPDELVLMRGAPYLEDRIGPFRLKLHPMNFLQPNPVQAERMYARLCAWVSHAPDGVAWDLYCGIGLVGFYLSSHYRTVYGIDMDARNLEMARLNATENAIRNVQFHAGRVEDLLANKRFWLVEARPQLIVVDPPRSGLHPRVIASLLAARPQQIIYLSCNTQALARDLQQLVSGFPRYRLARSIAFDLFPHTDHLEVLTLLERA